MAWTTPRTWVSSELVTAALMNTHVRDNLSALYAGALALASQAQYDLMVASSSSQWGRLANGTAGQNLVASATGPAWGWSNILGVTRTVMSGDVTLTASSTPYQFLDPDAARVVNLPTAVTGLAFVITNFDASGYALTIKASGGSTVTTCYNGQTVTVIYDGTAWQVIG